MFYEHTAPDANHIELSVGDPVLVPGSITRFRPRWQVSFWTGDRKWHVRDVLFYQYHQHTRYVPSEERYPNYLIGYCWLEAAGC